MGVIEGATVAVGSGFGVGILVRRSAGTGVESGLGVASSTTVASVVAAVLSVDARVHPPTMMLESNEQMIAP